MREYGSRRQADSGCQRPSPAADAGRRRSPLVDTDRRTPVDAGVRVSKAGSPVVDADQRRGPAVDIRVIQCYGPIVADDPTMQSRDVIQIFFDR